MEKIELNLGQQRLFPLLPVLLDTMTLNLLQLTLHTFMTQLTNASQMLLLHLFGDLKLLNINLNWAI